LESWTDGIARAFIQHRLRDTNVRFSEDEIAQLAEQSQGHPAELARLCFYAYRDKMSNRR
jgi:hypothetical protein